MPSPRQSPSRLTDSLSAIHPLSYNSDDMFYHGRTRWTDQKIRSKVGSLDNYHHVPGGGDKDIHEIQYQFNAPNTISSRVRHH